LHCSPCVACRQSVGNLPKYSASISNKKRPRRRLPGLFSGITEVGGRDSEAAGLSAIATCSDGVKPSRARAERSGCCILLRACCNPLSRARARTVPRTYPSRARIAQRIQFGGVAPRRPNGNNSPQGRKTANPSGPTSPWWPPIRSTFALLTTVRPAIDSLTSMQLGVNLSSTPEA